MLTNKTIYIKILNISDLTVTFKNKYLFKRDLILFQIIESENWGY